MWKGVFEEYSLNSFTVKYSLINKENSSYVIFQKTGLSRLRLPCGEPVSNTSLLYMQVLPSLNKTFTDVGTRGNQDINPYITVVVDSLLFDLCLIKRG